MLYGKIDKIQVESRKVISLKNIKSIISKLKGKKVLAGGCFDILHIGHIKFLKAAKAQGDILIIALESDEFIKKNKKRKPYHSQQDRAEILSSLEFTDIIILLPFFKSHQDYHQLVKIIQPTVIAVTKGDPKIVCKEKQATTIGAKVITVNSLIKGYCSSLFISG